METHTSLSSQVSARERWLITALLSLGLITFAIDASNTRLILPQIMTGMRVELYQIHWIFTAPGIARTIMTASMGWLSGWFGPRPLYLLSIGGMTVGALGSMLAWDWPSLLVFRILAGVGGGMTPQLSQAIFYQIFPPGQRGMALGFALMGWSIGPAFGPLMGGNLLEFASWRIVYAVTLPLSGVGLLLAWWLLPPLRRPERRRLDVLGLLTLAVAVSTLLLALTQGNREGWDSQYILTLLAIAGVTSMAFVVVQLCRAEPLVELRLFGSVPFVMAMIVLFLTTMAFRGSEPMLPVLMQRLLGFEPLLVAWVQMLPNLIYGAMVILVGRLADRVPTHVLVMGGLTLYAAAFWGYAGVNELTTVAMMMLFMILRSTSEACIGSPNNLATLEAIPESKVYLVTSLTGLLRSIANTMGTAIAVVVWDVRYHHRIQQYAEATPLDDFGYTTTLHGVQQTLQWSGEIAAHIPTQTMALMQERLVAEASTAAWQDYFLFNALLAIVCLVPALPFWPREKYRPAAATETAPASTPATSTGVSGVQSAHHENPGRTR